MRLADVDEIMSKILYEVQEINYKLETAKAPAVDYLTGMRRGLIVSYLLLNGLTVTTKESDLDEMDNSDCAENRNECDENWYTELDDPKIGERSEE